MNDWIECSSCWAEFRVVHELDERVRYCPMCGGELEDDEDAPDPDWETDYDE